MCVFVGLDVDRVLCGRFVYFFSFFLNVECSCFWVWVCVWFGQLVFDRIGEWDGFCFFLDLDFASVQFEVQRAVDGFGFVFCYKIVIISKGDVSIGIDRIRSYFYISGFDGSCSLGVDLELAWECIEAVGFVCFECLGGQFIVDRESVCVFGFDFNRLLGV